MAWNYLGSVIYFFNSFFFVQIWIQWSTKRDDLRPRALFAFHSGIWNRLFSFSFSFLFTQPGATRWNSVEQPIHAGKDLRGRAKGSTALDGNRSRALNHWRNSLWLAPHTESREDLDFFRLLPLPRHCVFLFLQFLFFLIIVLPSAILPSRCTISLRQADDTAILYRANNFDNDAKFKSPRKV